MTKYIDVICKKCGAVTGLPEVSEEDLEFYRCGEMKCDGMVMLKEDRDIWQRGYLDGLESREEEHSEKGSPYALGYAAGTNDMLLREGRHPMQMAEKFRLLVKD